MSSDPMPAVYPDAINKDDYGDNTTAYEAVMKNVKEIAQRRGWWLVNEWKKDDGSGETILDKLALMVILTLKHGISYMKIWPDEHEEKICTSVRDAFDVYTLGNYTSIYQTPFMIESVPMLIAQIKANPIFDQDQLQQINPDNKKASSEIKEAYLQARYGRDTSSDQSATLIVNEGFVQEYVSKANADKIKAQDDGSLVMDKRDIGSPIIRHVYTAGGVWLYDKYTNLNEYPYIDYRIEPGPLYGVPMIERFIPANKSLDSVVSRLERYTHTMVTGTWLKRRGENFKINNIAGGQVVEYDATPPTQGNIAPLPQFVSYFIELLEKFMEEQGVSTSTLGKIPTGVKAHAAIESLKESEYANLVIPSRRLNSTVKKLATKCLEIADEYFITPHDITYKNKGDVVSFRVMGAAAIKARKKLKIESPDIVPLSKDTKLDIEISQGMAYTQEGKKATMQQVINTMLEYVQAGVLPPVAVQSVVQKYLETYQYGDTQEFMEDLDEAMKEGTPISEQTIQQIKIAVLESMKESGEIGPEASKKRIMENKIGAIEALKDANLIKPIQKLGEPAPQKPLSESLNIAFKDLADDTKNAVLESLGLPPSKMVSPGLSDQLKKHSEVIKNMTPPPVKNTPATTKAQG